MNSLREAQVDTAHRFVVDHDVERRTLLLHIAVTAPRDLTELAHRVARPEAAIRDELTALLREGVVYLHDSCLRTTVAAEIVADASAQELREIHDEVLAASSSGAATPPATLVALAESGCRTKVLLDLLIQAVNEHPEDAAASSALSSVARSLGYDEDRLRLLRAADAASRGRTDLVLLLTERLLTAESPGTHSPASMLAAAAHIQNNRLRRASGLHRHVGAEQIGHDGAWAVLADLGRGDLESAKGWRAAMGDDGLTSHAAGLTDLADGLLHSVQGPGDDTLDLLARSVSALLPFGSDVLLPDTPAALAGIIAISRGEPATADLLLERALRAGLGGEAGRRRHVLIAAWSLMVQGRLSLAERRLEELGSRQHLGDRDSLLFSCLQAGIAQRRRDLSAMRAAWRQIRDHTLGWSLTLYDLLPLGEMMVVAARLRDGARVAPMVDNAVHILAGLGHPPTWAVPLHWSGVQAAFQSEDPAALMPHANALTQARQSPYAATLAQAGHTWLQVLRHEAELSSVELSVRELAATGHIWDASRLAGQAALRQSDGDSRLALMQLAREISKDHHRTAWSPRVSSVLTERELDVGRLVLEGQGYRAIGEQLFISPKTVEHHVARIRVRLGASSRGELLEMLHDIILAPEATADADGSAADAPGVRSVRRNAAGR